MSASQVRPMRESDIPALSRLMASSSLWERYGVTQDGAAQRFRDGLASGANIAVAEWGGRPAGFIWYVERGAFNRSGYVMLVGVEPELRGRGIGQALMEHAERVMFASVEDVFLLVSDFNRQAQKFYARLGYQQVGAIPDYVVSGIAELILRKQRPVSG